MRLGAIRRDARVSQRGREGSARGPPMYNGNLVGPAYDVFCTFEERSSVDLSPLGQRSGESRFQSEFKGGGLLVVDVFCFGELARRTQPNGPFHNQSRTCTTAPFEPWSGSQLGSAFGKSGWSVS